MPRWKLYAKKAGDFVFGRDPREVIAAMNFGTSSMLSVMMGGKAKTWYDRHKEEFEKTGDELELERMLRHVKKEE